MRTLPSQPRCGLAVALVAAAALVSGCGELCKSGEVCVLVGTGDLGFSGENEEALRSKLASPTSVTTDPQGRLVVVDFSNMRLRTLTEDGLLGTLVGNGLHAYSIEGALPLDSPLENPIDAAWGPDGRLYIAPTHEGRIIRLGDDGRIERVVGTGELADLGDGGPALDAQMGYVGGMAFSTEGELYISDNSHHRIRRVVMNGSFEPADWTIETAVGTGERGLTLAGLGAEALLNSPERIAWDAANSRLLIADTNNHRVASYSSSDGALTTLAGTGERGLGGDGAAASDALLHAPVGVLPLPSGDVLVSDTENHRIRRVDPAGGIQTVAGSGEWVSDAPLSAPALEMPIGKPAGMHWTSDGDLLIAERGGHRVLRWTGASEAL